MFRRFAFPFIVAAGALLALALGVRSEARAGPIDSPASVDARSALAEATSVTTPVPLPPGARLCPDVDSLFYGNDVLLPLITPVNPAGGTAALWRVASDAPFTQTLIYLPGQLVCGVDVMTATVSSVDRAILPTDGFLHVIDLPTNSPSSVPLPNRLRVDVDAQLSPVGSPGPTLLLPVIGGLVVFDLGSGAAALLPIPTDIVPGVDLVLTPGGALGLLPTNGVLYKINVAGQAISATVALTATGLLVPDVDAVIPSSSPIVIVPVRNALDAFDIASMTRVWSTSIPSDLVPGSDARLRPSNNGQLLMPSIAHLSFVDTATGARTSTPLAGRLREQIDAYYAIGETRAIIPVLPAGGPDFDNNLDIFDTAAGALVAAPVITGDIEIAVDVGLDTDTSAVMPTMGHIHFINLSTGVVSKTLTGGRLRPDVDLLIMPGGGKAAFATGTALYLLNGVAPNTGLLPVVGSLREIDLVAETQTVIPTPGAIMIGVDAASQSNTSYFHVDEDMVCWVCYPLKVHYPPYHIPPYIDNRGTDPIQSLTLHKLGDNSLALIDMANGQLTGTITPADLGNRTPVGPIDVDPLNQFAMVRLSQSAVQSPTVAIIDLWRLRHVGNNFVRLVPLPFRPIWRPVFDPDNGWVLWRLSNGWVWVVNLFNGQPINVIQPPQAAIGRPVIDTINKRYLVRTRNRCLYIHDLLANTGNCVTHPGGARPIADPVVDVNTGIALAPYSDGKLGLIDTELLQLSLVSVNPIRVSCAGSNAPRRATGVTLDHANSTAIVHLSDGCAGLVDVGRHARRDSFFDVFTEIELPPGYKLDGRPEFDSNSHLAVMQVVSRTTATDTNLIVVDLLGTTPGITNTTPISPGKIVSVIGPRDPNPWWTSQNPGRIDRFRVEPHKHMLGVRTLNGFAMLDFWNLRRGWFLNNWAWQPIQWWTWYAYNTWWPGWRIWWWDYDWVNDWTLLYLYNANSADQHDLSIVDMDSFQLQPFSGQPIPGPRFQPWQLDANARFGFWLRGPWWWYFNIWTKELQFYTLNGRIVSLWLHPWVMNPFSPPDPNRIPDPVMYQPSAPPRVVNDTTAPTLDVTRLSIDLTADGATLRGMAGAAEPNSTLFVRNTHPDRPIESFFDVFFDGGFGGPSFSFFGLTLQAADDSVVIPAEPGDAIEVTVCDEAGNCSAAITLTVPSKVYLPTILKNQ